MLFLFLVSALAVYGLGSCIVRIRKNLPLTHIDHFIAVISTAWLLEVFFSFLEYLNEICCL